MQFKLGFEDGLPIGDFQHGVAVSSETSQTLPDIDALLPKAPRFNDYPVEYPHKRLDFIYLAADIGEQGRALPGPVTHQC